VVGVSEFTAGSFHRGRLETVQYLCLHPLGPAAEMLRHQIGPGGDSDHLRLNLWTAIVDVPGVVKIDFANCTDHGITPDELVGDDCVDVMYNYRILTSSPQ